MRTRYIDPATGDYVLDGASLKTDRTAASSVVLAVRTSRGSAAAAAWFGNRTRREVRKATANSADLGAKYSAEAVAHLVESRRIANVKPKGTADGTVLVVELAYLDNGTGRPLSTKVSV